ncbi:hypothetical protein KSP40_PGU016600 [Platanthera guangdongensis]|uniref:ABC transporter domain-containing protein n=1 Tax=Platanthera guangdongensis TaxID=2320717 RepID=A0ABR2LLX1_9ASPA
MRAASVSSSSPDYLPRFCSRSGPLRVSSEHSCLEVKKLRYRSPGTQLDLLSDVTLSLPVKRFGLVFGRSGSGKTTLLQILAGLCAPTSGSICIQHYGSDGSPKLSPEILLPERVGIVFQFPERYFLADTVLEEVTFGWPRQKADSSTREQLASNLQYAFSAVGLHAISLEENPHSLSGGFKRRLALAVQLVQKPALLLLDEPLAGLALLHEKLVFPFCFGIALEFVQRRQVLELNLLHVSDWKARADVVKLLKHLKKELTILAVSHDLKELSALVDASWRMEMGGILKEERLTL